MILVMPCSDPADPPNATHTAIAVAYHEETVNIDCNSGFVKQGAIDASDTVIVATCNLLGVPYGEWSYDSPACGKDFLHSKFIFYEFGKIHTEVSASVYSKVK